MLVSLSGPRGEELYAILVVDKLDRKPSRTPKTATDKFFGTRNDLVHPREPPLWCGKQIV
jgi:hypothetical protein